jgi:hypothetical protein
VALLDFGHPMGKVIQYAYVVEDIEKSMLEFAKRLGVGPWFSMGPFTAPAGIYRGKPTDLRMQIALGFAGHSMIELIQQVNDVPSVYKEIVDKRGYGFHHYAVPIENLERGIDDYKQAGYEVAFTDRSPRGVRLAYIDTTANLPGMVELIEVIPSLESRYTEMYKASLGWDGTDPIRHAH